MWRAPSGHGCARSTWWCSHGRRGAPMSSNLVDDELLALHQRLLDGDRAVSSELVPLLLSHLQQRLAYLRASVDDPDEVTSQTGLAVTHYLNDPERFDPSRGSLVAYLAMVVRGDVLNELDARRRRRTHEVPSDQLVELDPPDRNTMVKEEALDAAVSGATSIRSTASSASSSTMVFRSGGSSSTS